VESLADREARIEALAEARALRRAGVEDRALSRSNLPGILFAESAAGPPVSPRSALTISDAWACIRLVSDSVATLPLHVYRPGAAGGRELVDDPTADLLRRPAPAITTADLMGQLVLHLMTWGNAYVGKYRDDSGGVFQLGLISPDRVQVELKAGMPLYNVVDANGRPGTYTTSDIVHVRALSLDGLVGLSPVAQARDALGLARSVSDHGSAFFRNGARPSGLLRVPPGPDQEDLVENLREGFERRHGGESNAGRVAVLTGEVTFEAVSLPLADAQWLESREFSTREVCRIFGVPPWMIGGSVADSLTYSTVAEQARAFTTFCLRPWLTRIEHALGADVDMFPPGRGTYPAFELDAMLRADPGARAAVYTAALNPQTGWMDRAEVRALEDLPASPSGPAPTEPPSSPVPTEEPANA
jgi:HK97 family phage portal protein